MKITSHFEQTKLLLILTVLQARQYYSAHLNYGLLEDRDICVAQFQY